VQTFARCQLRASAALERALPANAIHRRRKPRRVAPAILLQGPRGCGKASLCSAVATTMFPHTTSVCWLNMAHYSGPGAVAQLLGPPPGMVGHQEGGVLTQQLRKRRRFLLVLEGVHHAHPAALKLLINIVRDSAIEAGSATLDCRHVTILATSLPSASFRPGDSSHAAGQRLHTEHTLLSSGRGAGTSGQAADGKLAEFVRHMDARVLMEPLHQDTAMRIVHWRLKHFMEELHQLKGVSVQVDCAAVHWALACSQGILYDQWLSTAGECGFDGFSVCKAVDAVEESVMDEVLECGPHAHLIVGVQDGRLHTLKE
jgi:ATP-dependent Clp protease ATP-binding subunit ClpB